MELRKIEDDITSSMDPSNEAFFCDKHKKFMMDLIQRKNIIMKAQEEEWLLKSRATWIKGGDKIQNFFIGFLLSETLSTLSWT